MRRLIAIAAAALVGLSAGLIAVIAINGDDAGSRTGTAQSGSAPPTVLDPVETLRTHFELLEQGRFPTAADDLTPELLDGLGGKSVWVSERIADFLIDAQLDASLLEQTDTTATVRVDPLRTESLANGCTEFSGSYSMVRSGDRWLIASADLVDRPC